MSGIVKHGRVSIVVILILVIAALSITTVLAADHAEVLYTFDSAAGELPEGVAVDKKV